MIHIFISYQKQQQNPQTFIYLVKKKTKKTPHDEEESILRNFLCIWPDFHASYSI